MDRHPRRRITPATMMLAAAWACVLMGGCQASPLGDEFKQTLTLDRLGHAALKAALDPEVWAPAIAIGALSIDNADHRVSDWAVKHTPIYGSTSTAASASDVMNYVSMGASVGLWAARPTYPADDPAGEQTLPDGTTLVAYTDTKKVRDIILDASAAGATALTTYVLKETTNRTRPNGGGDTSFPSGHASNTAANSQIARFHLQRNQNIPDVWKGVGSVALIGLPYATGWARVEADKHYPTDVLFGILLGNFFTKTVGNLIDTQDTKEPLAPDVSVYAHPEPEAGGMMLGIRIDF